MPFLDRFLKGLFGTDPTLRLPQDESGGDARRRLRALDAARREYAFDPHPVGPPGAVTMPHEEDLTYREKFGMAWSLATKVADLGLGDIHRHLEHLDGKLEGFDELYPVEPIPAVSRRWRQDAEFGRQRLVGANPLSVRRCVEPPPFPLADDVVSRLVGRETSIRGLLAERRLYCLDYGVFAQVRSKDERAGSLADPYALFHRDAADRLLPLAIQLERSQRSGPVFTPLDPPDLWTLVKVWVQNADGMYQEIVEHLLRTHLVSETFWVGACRQLSVRHPLHELLKPHFRSTIAINWHARHELLAPGGPIDQCFSTGCKGALELIARAADEYRFDAYDPERDFAARGVDDELALPGYHYREDARKIWKALRRFVDGVVGHFYHDDGDVPRDTELQSWMGELVGVGLRGLPLDEAGRLTRREDLVQILTQTIFTSSAEHACINNGQYDYFGYLPNCAGLLVKEPPRTHDEVSEDFIAATLPGFESAATQIGIAYMLSRQPGNLLGTYPDDFFEAYPAVRQLGALLNSDLAAISSQIRRRNLVAHSPYPYLDPQRIGRSVEI